MSLLVYGVLGLRNILFPPPWPEILRDLPRAHETGSDLRRRVQKRFPNGTHEAAIIQDLESQGFTVQSAHPDGATAVYERSAFVCRYTFRVHWQRGDDGRISNSDATWDTICL